MFVTFCGFGCLLLQKPSTIFCLHRFTNVCLAVSVQPKVYLTAQKPRTKFGIFESRKGNGPQNSQALAQDTVPTFFNLLYVPLIRGFREAKC